jgi:hypothetical protein
MSATRHGTSRDTDGTAAAGRSGGGFWRAKAAGDYWGPETSRALAFLLHLSMFLTLFVVILWPASNYVSFFRYGNVPILYEFTAFVLPLAVALGSAYLGILSGPHRGTESGDMPQRVAAELVGVFALSAATAPTVVIAGSVSRASVPEVLSMLLVVTTTALAFRPLGLLAQTLTRNRSLQYGIMWIGVIVAFYGSAYRLPDANPVVGMTNAAGATRIGVGSIFFVELPEFNPVLSALYHLAFAGFLTLLLVLSAGRRSSRRSHRRKTAPE